MITLNPCQIPCSLKPRHLKPLHSLSTSLSNLKPLHHHHHHKTLYYKKYERGICRAELSHDAPFTAAIGACMLSSLLLPNTDTVSTEEDTDSAINSTDTRFAVMGIVSFIPFFNWLSWVFAWLDTGKKRYAVYSLVYLAPYLRSNLSLSPEESWLPIASIVFCIIHIQLEASIRNGDLQGFQLFRDAARHLSSLTRKKDVHLNENQGISKEESESEHINLSSGEEQSRNEIGQWGVPKKPVEHDQQLNGDWDDDKRRKH